eukprot:16433569-Heterocapsa_arctica.AAC.1
MCSSSDVLVATSLERVRNVEAGPLDNRQSRSRAFNEHSSKPLPVTTGRAANTLLVARHRLLPLEHHNLLASAATL